MSGAMPALDPAAARPAIIGLGYVGLPLALAFGQQRPTLGFDVDAARIDRLRQGKDTTGECAPAEFASAVYLQLTHNPADLASANVLIVAVPTPVTALKRPDLSPLELASITAGKALKRGDVVIFESTVYPGATEEVCVPILEQTSNLKFNRDFFVGYSPERINPGDRRRRLTDIVKVTAGSTEEAAAFVDALYRQIITAGTHSAPSISVAEASKAIENTQRDVNIALVNEFAQLLGRLGIDTDAVLNAAATKWNFLNFRPGLVGGHCIGVDPYYLVHKAQEVGFYPEMILAARRINEGMSAYVTGEVLKLMARSRINIVGARILVLGITFKENCPDLRNTRVVEIVESLQRYHADVDVFDPWASADDCRHEYGIDLLEQPAQGAYDAVILAVAHREFIDAEQPGATIRAWCNPTGVIYDVKHAIPSTTSDARL